MKRNTSIVLSNYFEEFVENRISEERYRNASEMIRAGWRLLEEEGKRVIALKNAIKEGLESDVGKTLIQRTLLNLIKSQQANKQLSSCCQISH